MKRSLYYRKPDQQEDMISATYPVLTIVLAFIFLKEKLNFKSLIGLVLVVISILGIGFLAK